MILNPTICITEKRESINTLSMMDAAVIVLNFIDDVSLSARLVKCPIRGPTHEPLLNMHAYVCVQDRTGGGCENSAIA